MAVAVVITCPECEKKFKPKADVQGKKIKCPFCTHAFVAPAAKAVKPDKGKPRADAKAAPVAPAAPEPARDTSADRDEDPYGVKQIDMSPRCPNCTHEMEDE